MKDVGTKVMNGLLKRQLALDRFKAKKEAFFLKREQLRKDIEEARIIWEKTLKQLTEQPLS